MPMSKDPDIDGDVDIQNAAHWVACRRMLIQI